MSCLFPCTRPALSSTVPLVLDAPGSSFLAVGPPQSSYVTAPVNALSSSTDLLGVSRPPRDITRRVHSSRGFPVPRFVPPSGFLNLSAACSASRLRQLISSGSHVQDFLSRGFSLRAATLPHREELPSCRSASADFPQPARRPVSYSIRGRLDSKALLRSKMRSTGLVFSRPRRRSPHQVFKSSATQPSRERSSSVVEAALRSSPGVRVRRPSPHRVVRVVPLAEAS